MFEHREYGVADTASNFEYCLCRFDRIGRCLQLWKFGEQPVSIFEEFILMNVVKCIPKWVGLLLKSVTFVCRHSNGRILFYTCCGIFFLLVVPFNVVPVVQIKAENNSLADFNWIRLKKNKNKYEIPCIMCKHVIIFRQITISELFSCTVCSCSIVHRALVCRIKFKYQWLRLEFRTTLIFV